MWRPSHISIWRIQSIEAQFGIHWLYFKGVSFSSSQDTTFPFYFYRRSFEVMIASIALIWRWFGNFLSMHFYAWTMVCLLLGFISHLLRRRLPQRGSCTRGYGLVGGLYNRSERLFMGLNVRWSSLRIGYWFGCQCCVRWQGHDARYWSMRDHSWFPNCQKTNRYSRLSLSRLTIFWDLVPQCSLSFSFIILDSIFCELT
jgi:hypothetical protein